MRKALWTVLLVVAGHAAAPGGAPAQPRPSQRRRHPRRRPGLGRPERPRQHEPRARRTSTRWPATAPASSGSSSGRSARRRGPSSSPAATTRAAASAASRPAASGSTSTSETIADVFKAAGYATGRFGKWHNGTQYPYHPNGRGFDEYYGFTSGHWGDYFDPPLDHNGKSVRGKGYITDDLTDHAIGVHRAEPRTGRSSAIVPFNTPHSPMQVPDKLLATVQGRRR